METYRHLMDVSAQLHAAAVLPVGNNPGAHLIGGWVSPTAGLGVLEERKISCSYRDPNPEPPSP